MNPTCDKCGRWQGGKSYIVTVREFDNNRDTHPITRITVCPACAFQIAQDIAREQVA